MKKNHEAKAQTVSSPSPQWNYFDKCFLADLVKNTGGESDTSHLMCPKTHGIISAFFPTKDTWCSSSFCISVSHNQGVDCCDEFADLNWDTDCSVSGGDGNGTK